MANNRRKHLYSTEEDSWIRENLNNHTYRNLVREFNTVFYCDVTTSQMLDHVTKDLGLRRDTCHHFTPEQEAWLRDHVDSGTYEYITQEFNCTFHTSLTVSSISDKMIKRMKLHKSVNRGNVSKGERRCTNVLPIGSEVFHGQDVYVKISDEVNDCKNRLMPNKHNDINWKRKDYIVWEQHGGVLPKDSSELIIHLDGDKQNCSIENLYKTTRKINFMLAKNKWFSKNPDITLAGIKWCELFYELKDKLIDETSEKNSEVPFK